VERDMDCEEGEEEVDRRDMEGRGWLVRWLQAPSSVGMGRSEGKDVSVLLALRQKEKGWVSYEPCWFEDRHLDGMDERESWSSSK
jgi:hypothetical protein